MPSATLSLHSLLIICILCSLNQAASKIYYITANLTDLYTGLCLTLSQFATNSSHYLYSNTTLVFLPGTHYLSNVSLTLINVDSFVMKSGNSTAHIECTNDSHILFSQSQSIHIAYLKFIGCGGNQVSQVEKFVIQGTTFRGQDNSGTALELIETMVQIVNSTFVSNKKGSYKEYIRSFYLEFVGSFGGGAITATNSTIDISQSKFEDNRAELGGAIFAEQQSIIYMSNVVFIKNSATLGGGLYSQSSTILIVRSVFHTNNATDGGVLGSTNSIITTKASKFYNNTAIDKGGVSHSFNCTIAVEASKFYNNIATKHDGGVLILFISTITMRVNEIYGNTAAIGGAVFFSYSIVNIEASDFHDNNATWNGGALASRNSTITINGSNFTRNNAPIGAVMYAHECSIQHHNYLIIEKNSADKQAVVYLSRSEIRAESIVFSSNLGSLVAFNSNITFADYAIFVNNQPPQTTRSDFQEGGAITLLQSNVYFYGTCYLEHNYAENGGALYSTESALYLRMNSNVTIAHNIAVRNGGGVYLSTSELHCQQESNFELYNNTAAYKGGGLHAISSSIKAISSLKFGYYPEQYSGTRIKFTNNLAKKGGGISLDANAKLYVLKYDDILLLYGMDNYNTVIFTANIADYGGAIYVDDDTNSGMCTSDQITECFFQVLAIYVLEDLIQDTEYLITQSLSFSHNFAGISGSTVYGGLLDRCAVSQFAEVRIKYKHHYKDSGDGLAYIKNVSFPTNNIYYYEYIFNVLHDDAPILDTDVTLNTSISSDPVQVCFCSMHNKHECTHQGHVQVKKGEMFTLSLVAVDQVGQSVNAIIQSSLMFPESGLTEGQLAREIISECTNLEFNIVSPHSSESLTVYASDGPCNDADLSSAKIDIHFLPCSCPIGLQVIQMNSTNCTCECHSDINQYVKQCDIHTRSVIKEPQSRAWISYINDTNVAGYLVYPNCPFDYCLVISPPIDLSQPNGADAQCAFNRSSLLCGSCQPGLSLSLGGSHCLQCPNYWPVLLIAITITAFLAGIALVILLLVLNMTVAVGTLNGLIFYANVVYANKSILFPFRKTNFVTVVISWLNLELGIDTCYFPKNDIYIKTWLQLAFPAYVILLVVLVITISSYSTKFSNLIGKRNPVATLATLILLSYAKLLEICFKSLSVGILEYPDGSSENLWLPDATVKYLSGKHIPLFIAAVLILLVGLVYTILLFSWQWFLYLPAWRIFRWSRNPKIQTFVETYHTPYTPKHRYWTGLLLIVRIIFYLVSAVNVSNNPIIALTAISFTVCCIFVFKQFVGSRMYSKWPVDVLDTFFYFNLLSFAIFTWYSLDEPNSNQEAAAYTSVTITFIVLLLIILYHVYTCTKLHVFSKIKLCGMIDRLFTDTDPKPKPEHHRRATPDDDIHRFNELLDMIDRPVNADDYKVPLKQQKPVKPTQSVVEVHQPQLAPPDPEELADIQHIPVGAAKSVQAEVNNTTF